MPPPRAPRHESAKRREAARSGATRESAAPVFIIMRDGAACRACHLCARRYARRAALSCYYVKILLIRYAGAMARHYTMRATAQFLLTPRFMPATLFMPAMQSRAAWRSAAQAVLRAAALLPPVVLCAPARENMKMTARSSFSANAAALCALRRARFFASAGTPCRYAPGATWRRFVRRGA